MGFQEVLATASTSAISAVCMTYLTERPSAERCFGHVGNPSLSAGSQWSFQRSISSCRGPSKGGSSRLLFASGSSDGRPQSHKLEGFLA